MFRIKIISSKNGKRYEVFTTENEVGGHLYRLFNWNHVTFLNRRPRKTFVFEDLIFGAGLGDKLRKVPLILKSLGKH